MVLEQWVLLVQILKVLFDKEVPSMPDFSLLVVVVMVMDTLASYKK